MESLSKDSFRKDFRTKRIAFFRSEEGPLATSKVRDWVRQIVQASPGIWIAYRGVRSELDFMNQELFDCPGVKWVFPVTTPREILLYAPHDWTEFIGGKGGIPEPDPSRSEPIELKQTCGAFVPGVAFDRNGSRLGSGQGYFDRLLTSYTGRKVGIAYSVQISNSSLPTDSHDVPMDMIVTENFVLEKGPFICQH